MGVLCRHQPNQDSDCSEMLIDAKNPASLHLKPWLLWKEVMSFAWEGEGGREGEGKGGGGEEGAHFNRRCF